MWLNAQRVLKKLQPTSETQVYDKKTQRTLPLKCSLDWVKFLFFLSKFWTRNRPGDKMRDKYNLNTHPLGDDDYGKLSAIFCLHEPGYMEASRPICRWNVDWYFYFRPGKQAEHVISLENNFAVLLRVFTTVWRDIVSNEGNWELGLPSINWKVFSTLGDSISTVKGYHPVLRRIFSTVKSNDKHWGGNTQSACGLKGPWTVNPLY